jgi:hypothetical protein
MTSTINKEGLMSQEPQDAEKGWLEYEGRSLSKEPKVTIQKQGKISINEEALEKLDNPKGLVLSYNKDLGLIGIRATHENEKKGFLVSKHKPTDKTIVINTARFLQFINYPLGELKSFTPEFKNGRLVIDVSSLFDEGRKNGTSA